MRAEGLALSSWNGAHSVLPLLGKTFNVMTQSVGLMLAQSRDSRVLEITGYNFPTHYVSRCLWKPNTSMCTKKPNSSKRQLDAGNEGLSAIICRRASRLGLLQAAMAITACARRLDLYVAQVYTLLGSAEEAAHA
eukprot:s438_g15.t1